MLLLPFLLRILQLPLLLLLLLPQLPTSDALLPSRRHRSTLHALQTCPSDNRPLSAHVPANTSFRQASPNNMCCVHIHVFLGQSSFNTVYSEFWLSDVSVRLDVIGIIRDVLNLSSIPRDVVDLSSVSPDVVDLSFSWPRRVAGSSLTPLRPSTLASNVLQLCGSSLSSSIRAFPSGPSASSPHRQGCSTPGTFTMVSSRRATASCTRLGYGSVSLFLLRAATLSPSTPWRPLVHVA